MVYRIVYDGKEYVEGVNAPTSGGALAVWTEYKKETISTDFSDTYERLTNEVHSPYVKHISSLATDRMYWKKLSLPNLETCARNINYGNLLVRVSIPTKFNTPTQLNTLFGSTNLGKIKFDWSPGFIEFGNNIISKPFIPFASGVHAGKKVKSISVPEFNSFQGLTTMLTGFGYPTTGWVPTIHGEKVLIEGIEQTLTGVYMDASFIIVRTDKHSSDTGGGEYVSAPSTSTIAYPIPHDNKIYRQARYDNATGQVEIAGMGGKLLTLVIPFHSVTINPHNTDTRVKGNVYTKLFTLPGITEKPNVHITYWLGGHDFPEWGPNNITMTEFNVIYHADQQSWKIEPDGSVWATDARSTGIVIVDEKFSVTYDKLL